MRQFIPFIVAGISFGLWIPWVHPSPQHTFEDALVFAFAVALSLYYLGTTPTK